MLLVSIFPNLRCLKFFFLLWKFIFALMLRDVERREKWKLSSILAQCISVAVSGSGPHTHFNCFLFNMVSNNLGQHHLTLHSLKNVFQRTKPFGSFSNQSFKKLLHPSIGSPNHPVLHFFKRKYKNYFPIPYKE